MYKLCVFAGTVEGRRLIERLSGRGVAITACVATEYGQELIGEHEGVEVRAERLDAAGMEKMFAEARFDAVVDATHPYASAATANIAAACAATGTVYMRLERASSAGADDGVFVRDVAECVEYLRGTDGNVLLTTGSKDLPEFCADESLRARLYARVLPLANSLSICESCGIPAARVIAMQGPFGEELNYALLRQTHAAYMVTKDTGGAGGYAEKIRAALRAGATPVIIGRPPQREGSSLADMVARLEERFALERPIKRVTLVGIGMGGTATRTLGMERALSEADCVIGAKRMLESVETAGKRTYTAILARDIARAIREDGESRRFAVLLSGDTGFYSGARGLVSELSGDADITVEVLPGIGSLQYFCARLARPWDDVRCVSLHGRECPLEAEVAAHSAVFGLVGGEGGIRKAMRRLADAGFGALKAQIGERLGYDDEKITAGTVAELAEREFDPLSVFIVENPACRERAAVHGLPDEAFERDETPMTKSEVRSVSLSKLELRRDSVCYDVGSGSGSVSVEMALCAQYGHVYAIEMKDKAAALTRVNRDKFHITNMDVIEGRAPDVFAGLPAPTHAFIGGSAGSMRGIIDALLALNPRVRIVANAVTLETITELSEIARGFSFSDICEISVSKPRALGRYRLMTAQNPVYIFAMQNPEAEQC